MDVDTSEAATRIGQTVDRYALEAVLGAGGFGAVYRARHVMMDRAVALKLLHSHIRDPQLQERFLREARTAAAIGHPNIVQVYDCGLTSGGEAFLAMELLDGRDLAQLLEERRKLPWREAVALVVDVLAGLQAAHQAGVVHRDLKPGNVFLPRSGGIKLLDFGISKLEGKGVPQLTQTGVVMGTPHYMAPETFAGARDVDQRADLYSIAAMLYEMVGGSPPHDADTYERLVIKVATMPAPSARALPDVPHAIADVIDRGLVANPAERWASADDFRAALANATTHPGSMSAMAGPETPMPISGTEATGYASTPGPWTLPNPSAPPAAFPSQAATPSPLPTEARPREPRGRGPWIAVALLATLLVAALVVLATITIRSDSDNTTHARVSPQDGVQPPVAPQPMQPVAPQPMQPVAPQPMQPVAPQPMQPVAPQPSQELGSPAPVPAPVAPVAPTPAPILEARVTPDQVLGLEYAEAGALARRAAGDVTAACGGPSPQVVRVMLMRGANGRIAIAREANEDFGELATARCVANHLAAHGPMGTESGGIAVFRVALPGR